MKVETPQILWHNGAQNDNGKNAPILSISILQSEEEDKVLATCGTSSEVHLWKLKWTEYPSPTAIFHEGAGTVIEHLQSLDRHERSVNCVAFSPNGRYLGSAGDAGAIVIWCNKKGSWLGSEEECSLMCQIPMSHISGDIMDLSWCPSSKRFVVGSMDHTVCVFECVGDSWSSVFRARDHVSYVQGVSWDPLGAYLASMSTDKTVRVYMRKQPKRSKGVLTVCDDNASHPPEPHPLDAKFELGKPRVLKYRNHNNANKNLFADESTVESFFRRLNWTTDGKFLITPAALWYSGDTPSYATFLFARHDFERPVAVLTGLDKPSVVIKPCPVLFQTPPQPSSKENSIPYRSLFAVLTIDTVLIYDTFHWGKPLLMARGLHYAALTDCEWTPDATRLLVTSSDGYISIISFQPGELGKVYIPSTKATTTPPLQVKTIIHENVVPACPPGQTAVLEAPPAKRIKIDTNSANKEKKRITPTVVVAPDKVNDVITAVTDLTLQVKKKKRLQPILLSSGSP